MILALHGFTGRGSDFQPLRKKIPNHWHCPDMPGHGPTASNNCSPEATLEFIERERQAAIHLELGTSSPLLTKKRVLLGYSMGARAALLSAVNKPQDWDALILISANPGIEGDERRKQRALSDAKLCDKIENHGMDAFLEYWNKTPLIVGQQNIVSDLREAMDRARRAHAKEGLCNSLRHFGQGTFPNLWPELKKLKLPILLLTGTRDQKYCQIAERMLAELLSGGNEHAKHVPVKDASHAPHLEQLNASCEIIQNFLS